MFRCEEHFSPRIRITHLGPLLARISIATPLILSLFRYIKGSDIAGPPKMTIGGPSLLQTKLLREKERYNPVLKIKELYVPPINSYIMYPIFQPQWPLNSCFLGLNLP